MCVSWTGKQAVMIPGWMMLWRSLGANHKRRSMIGKSLSHSSFAKKWDGSWRSKASMGLVQTCPA